MTTGSPSRNWAWAATAYVRICSGLARKIKKPSQAGRHGSFGRPGRPDKSGKPGRFGWSGRPGRSGNRGNKALRACQDVLVMSLALLTGTKEKLQGGDGEACHLAFFVTLTGQRTAGVSWITTWTACQCKHRNTHGDLPQLICTVRYSLV